MDADFDEGYLLKFSQAFASLARAMADAATVPAWQPGDPFAPGSEPASK